MIICPTCDGSKTVKCSSCEGEGHKYFVPLLGFWESDCTECYGLGNIDCPDCEGLGEICPVIPNPVNHFHSESNPHT